MEIAKYQTAWISCLWLNSSGEVNYLECLPLSLFEKRVDELKGVIHSLHVFGVFEDKIKAFNALEKWRYENGLKSLSTVVYEGLRDTRARAVECVETGESWHSANHCAEKQGLNKGNLSNHLNGRKGYMSIKGKTYRWVGKKIEQVIDK